MSPLSAGWLVPAEVRTDALPAGRAAGDDDYLQLCRCLLELTGIDLCQYKRGQMERRLRTLYEQRYGIRRLSDVGEALRRDPRMLEELLDRITTVSSQLWRSPEQWELIEQELLPELVAQPLRRELRLWSAGCAHGAEVYTLAALCRLVCPTRRVKIQGTDIDRRLIERARLGLFSTSDAEPAPTRVLETGFDRVEGGWRANLELRALTRFDQGDLLRVRPQEGSVDLILCRNTVIYFVEPLRDAVHARLADGLRPGGYLVLGSTEQVARPAELGLRTVRPCVYQRV